MKETDFSRVRAFVFDVDGVFALPEFYLHPSGDFMRSMNTKDGYAVQHTVKEGFPLGIISGGKSQAVKQRFQGLGVTDIYLGSVNKMEDFDDFLFKYDLKTEEILYMGDDVPDFEVMMRVGLPTCPADAIEEIKAISSYISPYKGGKGCVRDVLEKTLKAQGKWVVDPGSPYKQ